MIGREASFAASFVPGISLWLLFAVVTPIVAGRVGQDGLPVHLHAARPSEWQHLRDNSVGIAARKPVAPKQIQPARCTMTTFIHSLTTTSSTVLVCKGIPI